MKFIQLHNQLKDPASQERWRIRMPQEDYQFQCMAESVEMSIRNVPAKQRFAQGRNFNYADVSTLEGINIVFYETYDFSVTDYLRKWKLLVYNSETGAYGPPASYERTIVVEMLNYEDDSVIKTFEYLGAWPTDTSPITASYEDPNGRIQITQPFAVRDVRQS
jgi:hypothetical protein